MMKDQRELGPVDSFLAACELERREQRHAARERKVLNGRLVSAERGRFSYSFDLQSDTHLREDSSVQLIVSGSSYHGIVQVLAGDVHSRTITIAIAADLGPTIRSGRIESQEQDLVQALIVRLRGLRCDKDGYGWNSDLAKKILDLRAHSESAESVPSSALPGDLTGDQQTALVRCLSQPVTFVWGPPGTGKTVLLAALAWQLYQENKRVLIVSHTNHAVDGVVENLCRRITERGRSVVPEGSLLRVGTIVKPSLLDRFGAQVSLDAVIARSQDKVAERLAALTVELVAVEDELFATSRKIALLESYAQLRQEIERVRNSDGVRGTGDKGRAKLSEMGDRFIDQDDSLHNDTIVFLEEKLQSVAEEIRGCTKSLLEERSMELSSRHVELSEAVAVLRKFTRDLRSSLLDRARIIATTATQAMLSVADMEQFDVVLIDEASMLPLPLCYLLSGYARERVVIAGDFRQLPSVARSSSDVVRLWYARDVFECAGVVDLVDAGQTHPAVVALTTQFRSHETLCALINNRFYGGILRTRADSHSERYIYRDPLAYLNRSPIVLVDTSDLEPWGAVHAGSKQNLVHALVVRKLALLLAAHGVTLLPESLGIIAPYRAQATLIRTLLEESSGASAVSVGTVHKFQGSEREAIILDLTESAPHSLGSFLNPSSLRDTGARLLNVALSRARRHLLVVVNLRHLRTQLSRESLMAGVLNDLERYGYYLPAAKAIGEPLFATPSREVCQSPGVLAFQAFDELLFFPAMATDLLEAQSEIVISTPEVGEREVIWIKAMLEQRIRQGVRFVVRVSTVHKNLGGQHGGSELLQLQRLGVEVLLGQSEVPSAVIIDREVLWVGALEPLNSLRGDRGVMARTVSAQAALMALAAFEPDLGYGEHATAV